jgi:AraC family transcriptional regulator
MTASAPSLLAILVHLQSHLDGDLGLAALSGLAGQSPSHFHRRFQAAIGETPKRHVARLRLERAAFRILIHDSTLLDIALECGFQNHETFTRAFHRHFGVTPSHYRGQGISQQRPVRRTEPPPSAGPFAISALKVRRLLPCHLAFLRHVGPYEHVPDELFGRLEQWAERRGLSQPRVWMGFGHDAPSTTNAEHLRFDAALVVPTPFTPTGEVGYQFFPGGDHAIVTHVGPFSTLDAAYASLFPQIMALSAYRVVGLPVVEIYQAAHIDAALPVNTTDLCIPVERL